MSNPLTISVCRDMKGFSLNTQNSVTSSAFNISTEKYILSYI